MPDATDTMTDLDGTPQRPDHGWIKAEAKRRRSEGEERQRVPELLALSNANDPFYVGTSGDKKKAKWFAEVIERMNPTGTVHLRRVHYWCVSREGLTHYDGDAYANTGKCWTDLEKCSKKARYLSLVTCAQIADHKNPAPHRHAEYLYKEPSAVVTATDPTARVETTGFHAQDQQPYHLEVWCEKSTMNDVLRPVCEDYGANLVTGEGELSITACHLLAERIAEADKPSRIFYISDFDPAGLSMPRAVARKLEWMMGEKGIHHDVRLCPLVLTAEQVKQYDLPRTPIKKSELRRKSFEEAHGEGSVELDALEALHPGVLREIVSGALRPFYDDAVPRKVRTARRAYTADTEDRIEEIKNEYEEALAAVREMNERIRRLEVEAGEVPEAPPADAEPDQPWLYDSRRGYFEQLAAYDRYAEGESLHHHSETQFAHD